MRLMTRLVVPLLALALLVAGCASSGPTTIMVIDKEVRAVWDDRIIGYQTSPVTNRVVEVRSNQIIREYWVKDIDGKWHRVSARDWYVARPGLPLDLP